jgi:hypothetical protein
MGTCPHAPPTRSSTRPPNTPARAPHAPPRAPTRPHAPPRAPTRPTRPRPPPWLQVRTNRRLRDEPPPTTDELPPPNSTALCAMLKRAAQTADGLPRDPVLAAAHALPRLNPETHFIPQPSPKPKPKP